MSERFLTIDLASGEKKLQEALSTSAGAGDAGKIPALNGSGKLDDTLLPAGVGAETVTGEATENLSAGDFVQVWHDATNREVRKADANNGRPAGGFVLAAVTAGQTATVYPLGDINDQLSGLTLDEIYFLSATAGGVTADISAFASGDIVQRLGKAISTTAILTECHMPVVLADA